MQLADEAGGTRVAYQTQASVAGKLGQVGGRMIDAAARQMADQFFAAFQAELAPAPAAEPEAAGAPVEAAGSTTASTPAAAPAGPSPQAGTEPAAPARPTPVTPATPVRVAAPAPAPAAGGEASRVLWFVLGALSTGFGVWLGRTLFS